MDRFLVLPLLAPLVLLAAGNDAFAFDAPGYLDPFTYLGYFWHYPEHLWVFDDNSNYKISRLPWILPGYVLHTLTSPIVASYILAYLSLASGAVALYLLVRDGFGDRVSGAITAVAWAGCTWAHGIGGWNYHVLMATGYYLLACWLVVRAARTSSRSAAVAAGVLLACAVHTHLFLVIFVPFVAGLYLAALPPQERHLLSRGLRDVLPLLSGGLAITGVLAAINGLTGGTWLFLWPQIEQALKLTQPDYDHWWQGNAAQWLPSARYLVLPLAMMVAGLFAAFRARTAADRRLLLAAVVLAWAAFSIMCYFQFVRRQTTLDYSYMAFVLYPHAFICLGAVLTEANRGMKTPAWLAGVVSAAVLGTLLVLLPTPLPAAMAALPTWSALGPFAPLAAPIAFSLAGVAAMQLVGGPARVAVFAVWFGVVNASIAPAPRAYGIGTPGFHHGMLRMFREADRVTTELDPTLIGIKYWMADARVSAVGGEVRLQNVFDSYVATRAWFTNLLGRQSPSPAIAQLTLEDLDRGTCIGLLSSIEQQTTLQREMEAHYAGLGRPLQQVTSRQFEQSGLAFALTVLKPVSGPAGSAGARPPCAAP